MQTYAIRSNALILDRSMNREYTLTIHDLPTIDKPREKLISHGPQSLTMRELLTVMLVTGTTREGVMEMSNRIMKEYGEKSILAERNPQQLSDSLDIPLVKACQIVAAGELGRRYFDKGQSGFTTIRNAQDVYEYLQDMRNLSKEHLRGLYLNSHNRIIRDEVISIGTINANIIHPREVFRIALESNAVAVILAHNHPSGESTPSKEDVDITEQIVQAGKILGIPLIDHIVIAKDSYASVGVQY
jgi:DNA repair protein RadC